MSWIGLASQLASSKDNGMRTQNLPPGLTVEEYKELMDYNLELQKDYGSVDIKKVLTAVSVGTGLTVGAVWLVWYLEDIGTLPPVLHTLVRAIRQIGEGVKAIGNLPAEIKQEINDVANTGRTARQIGLSQTIAKWLVETQTGK